MTREVRHNAEQVAREYSGDQPRPLRGYLTVIGVYGALAGAVTGLARLTGRRAPQVAPADVVLVAVATHKLSRLLSKDAVTSPLRAPFTRFQGPTGEGELAEEVRGGGIRHAVGELLVCPFCAAVWVAGGFTTGLVFAPRLTRLVAATFAAVAGSDFLQLGYDAAKQGLDKFGE